ncbi:MAG TPA: MBL fold metallo-hydrolase [Longimicrobium sp.]|nr:MBL fold metallo-hydrolase [Longimicrobium sp.]
MPFLESPGVHRVDLNWNGSPGQVASYIVDAGDALAVVETGPTSTLPAVLAAIRELGRDPAEVTHLLVTHIHLDHAGGAGALLEHTPRARVHVHPVGAPHLRDPSRLIASATQLYGDQMDALWGEMVPVPADRLVVLNDGDEVRIGNRRLRAVETPGHAYHHHAYHDPDARLVFTGDVGGIRLERMPYVYAPTPPPEIDMDAWHESIRRIRALEPELLLLTHFGGANDPAWHLDELAARLRAWAAWTEQQATLGVDSHAMAASLGRRATADILAATGREDAVRAYQQAVPYPMMSAGLERWWKTRQRAAQRAGGSR